MLKEILFASSNKKKLEEVKAILKDINILVPDKEIYVEEWGNTFLANAFIKAKAYFDIYRKPVLAEDSGLIVKALKDLPGVYSKRFYFLDIETRSLQTKEEPEFIDKLNNEKLLKIMEKVKDREAYFVSNTVLIIGEDFGLFSEGRIEGYISYEERGDKGFGYDPIFIPKGYDLTMAQLSKEEKNKISHRRKALDKLKLLIDSLDIKL